MMVDVQAKDHVPTGYMRGIWQFGDWNHRLSDGKGPSVEWISQVGAILLHDSIPPLKDLGQEALWV